HEFFYRYFGLPDPVGVVVVLHFSLPPPLASTPRGISIATLGVRTEKSEKGMKELPTGSLALSVSR
ncbi:MAG TPA: hypothetical protein VI027_06905, partial [Rubrobacteraceae bacterium]